MNLLNPSMHITRRVIRDNPDVESQHVSTRFRISAGTLFAYLTEVEHLARWFGTVKRDDFVYEIRDSAHGRIESCKDDSFLITWETDDKVSFLNVEITQMPDGTVQLAAGFSTNAADISEDFAEKFGPGATGIGWDLNHWALDRYIAGDVEEPTTEAFEAFVAASSSAWAEADVAAGVDAETAGKRAENSRLFYLGLEE